MASQVLSGTGNVSYTNNTGQNVRIVINFMSTAGTIVMSWSGGATASSTLAIGKTLQYQQNTSSPAELMLAPGQTFSASNVGSYNIVVIPEAG